MASRIVRHVMIVAAPVALAAGCGVPARATGSSGRPPPTARPAAGGRQDPGPHGARSAASPAAASPAASPRARQGPAGAAGAAALWARAAGITDAMSLPEKVGQLLVATVPGSSAADGGAALVRRYHLGGVIYFAGNIHSAQQVAALSDGLQRAALAQRPAVPLLIGTDQEGGLVARLAGVATLFPGQMAAGATRDPALIRAQDRVTGQQMRALGINLDYAPVADVNVDPANPVIGIRSFGSDPGLVSRMTSAAVAGFHDGGVAATAKHFPGHGDTNVDSHTGLPVIHHTLRQWWHIDEPPFAAAIRAGVDEIMVAHIVVPALEPHHIPASLSHAIVTGYLRDKLGYNGVVTTDSLQMAGVANGHTNAQVAVGALLAGCDQLLMPASVPAAYHAVLSAVRSGRISRARLDASVTRVVALKLGRGLWGHALVTVGAAAGQENTLADQKTARRLASRSVTMVRNRAVAGSPVLPLAGRSVYLAGPAAGGLTVPLREALAAAGGHLVSSPRDASAIVVATRDATTDPGQRRLVAGLEASGRPVVVVATGVPYDLGLFPHAAAGLATYSGTGVSLAAAAEVLTGQLNPVGRLPVAVPGPDGTIVYPYGTGLHY